jgi:predicted membrane channel-forming protein YqfA (hemolysin III family)
MDQVHMKYEPTWRKPAGIFFILLLIAVWAVLVSTLSDFISHWPTLAQLPFYVATGMIWILPLKPLLQWMETGSFKRP